MTLSDQRRLESELMDEPGLDAVLHREALRGLQTVNALSGTGSHLWRALSRMATQTNRRPLTILDLACGGGDVDIHLARLAKRQGVSLSICGWDKSLTAIECARLRAEEAGLDNLVFEQRDALRDDVAEPFDIALCTLFLHHLSHDDGLCLLQKMRDAARLAVFVDDLRRTRRGYALAWLGCHLLTRSPIVRVDGPMSVKAAYTVVEARQLASQAGLDGAVITTHWPQRFLLQWVRP